MRQFTSDNRNGIVPEVWEALQQANVGHAASYGDDASTARATDMLRELFETDADVYFVTTGTAANSLALATLCQSYHSVICHEAAHVETDECGAPEFFSNGTKLLLASGPLGKLGTDAIESIVRRRTDIHYPVPRALSITQATELGTVYTAGQIATIGETAKRLGLFVHMDGARFSNAIATLGCRPAELSWRAGVDVLCLGGTKNGMLLGEAVVFFNRDLSREFAYRCKQAGQLVSKMRFISAQWVGLLNKDVWLKHATHANEMATRVEQMLRRELGHDAVLYPVEANGVFAKVPDAVLAGLRERGWELYSFIGGAVRFMCGWDTSVEDVDRLGNDLAECVEGAIARQA